MSRNSNRRISEFYDEHCCAGGFRRTSSLRLRGEKMVQRSPLSTRKHIPVITESNHQKHHGDGARSAEAGGGARQRSHVSTGHRPAPHSISYTSINHHGYVSQAPKLRSTKILWSVQSVLQLHSTICEPLVIHVLYNLQYTDKATPVLCYLI